MLMQEYREQVVEYGIKMLESGLTRGTGGNLSVLDREKGYFAISPSGIGYYDIKPEDVAIMDTKGNIIEAKRKPSSEWDMHRIFYDQRDDIDAIVHTHTTFAATVSCMNWDLPAVHYLVAMGGVDVRCAKYATFGTKQLALNAFEAMRDRKACLLANHGLLVGSSDLANAISATESLEFCCELYTRTKSMGEPVILPLDEMERMLVEFKWYGQVHRPEDDK